MDQPIHMILYLPFLVLRTILPIMHNLVLASSALPLDFFSCTCGVGELKEIIKFMMNPFQMWQHMLEAYSTNFV